MSAFPIIPARQDLGPRRALIVLLAFEGLVALAGAVALAFAAPEARDLLGGAFGPQATVAALLLAGLGLALAIGCFGAAGGLLRDRPGAEMTAVGIETTIVAAVAIGAISASSAAPELAVAAGIGLAGLLLALVAARGR